MCGKIIAHLFRCHDCPLQDLLVLLLRQDLEPRQGERCLVVGRIVKMIAQGLTGENQHHHILISQGLLPLPGQRILSLLRKSVDGFFNLPFNTTLSGEDGAAAGARLGVVPAGACPPAARPYTILATSAAISAPPVNPYARRRLICSIDPRLTILFSCHENCYLNTTRRPPLAFMSAYAGLNRLRKNPLPRHSERSEESRSGLFSGHCEIPRRLGLLGMTGHVGFPQTVTRTRLGTGTVAESHYQLI